MTNNPEKYHRHSIRLKSYDYSQEGAYFVTICTQDKKYPLGKVVGGNMELSSIGKIAQEYLFDISKHFANAKLDQFVIMPNHIHTIIMVEKVGAIHELPLRKPPLRIRRRKMLIPKIIGYFKMNCAKKINQMQNSCGMPVWQRNYYEHVIRSEKELGNIREYITNNPLKWELDRENPFSANYNLEHKKYFEGIYEQ
ncbi:MAG TPA: transposase [candidate division Zixibacteria bacterium]